MARVTLSFDNGPHAELTPRILDVLARDGVRATFFAVGQRLGDPKALSALTRAAREGHWVGNHTFSHRVPFGRNDDPNASEDEVEATQRLLGDLAHPDRLFRPFGGGGHLDERLLSRDLVAHLQQHAYTCVLWNAVPRDWEQPDAWIDTALEQIEAQPWSLVVLHDIIPGNDRQLELLLERLHGGGHEIVQEFPPECVPVQRGNVLVSLEGLIGR